MNPPVVFVLVCVGGGAGAAFRFLLDGIIRGRTRIAFPVGTTIINVTGSLGLGLLTGAAAHAGMPEDLLLILGGGLMGGYTTFSTASLETFRLAQERRFGAAVANSGGMLMVCIAAAWLGLLIEGAI